MGSGGGVPALVKKNSHVQGLSSLQHPCAVLGVSACFLQSSDDPVCLLFVCLSVCLPWLLQFCQLLPILGFSLVFLFQKFSLSFCKKKNPSFYLCFLCLSHFRPLFSSFVFFYDFVFLFMAPPAFLMFRPLFVIFVFMAPPSFKSFSLFHVCVFCSNFYDFLIFFVVISIYLSIFILSGTPLVSIRVCIHSSLYCSLCCHKQPLNYNLGRMIC